MKSPQKYASATAFRSALEDRLKKLAQVESLDLQRVRRQAAFDRLLCRLFANPNAQWLLKGGYAMELRLKTARTTRDIDLGLKQLPVPAADWDANAATILEALREPGKLDLQDFFTFVFGAAMQDLDAAPYGGARFPVDARLAGRSFVKFHLDVSTCDVLAYLTNGCLAGTGFVSLGLPKPTSRQFHRKNNLPKSSMLTHCLEWAGRIPASKIWWI